MTLCFNLEGGELGPGLLHDAATLGALGRQVVDWGAEALKS